MLYEDNLARHFSRIGADFRLKVANDRWSIPWGLDIVQGKRGQIFELRVSPENVDSMQVVPAHVAPKDRHLLLLVRSGESANVSRYLCGHDEREWFIATIPGKASTVAEAKEAGKPHMAEEVYRQGGELVYLRGRRTWTQEDVRKYREKHPGVRLTFRESRVRDAEVYARGSVRHSDHATLILRGWHRVLPNTEAKASAEARQRLVFLD